MIDAFQQELVDKLQASEEYQEAALYTVIAALLQDTDLEDVYAVLHMLAWDLDRVAELEELQDQATEWAW